MVATNRFNQAPYEDVLKQLFAEVTELRQKIELNANKRLTKYKSNYPSGAFSESACNLAHYLAMRQFDLRHLQDRLAQAGLSSLGRAEASVLSTLDSLIDILKRATGKHYLQAEKSPFKYGFNQGQQLLEQHAIELFGHFHEHNEHGKAHVMVTLATEASRDYTLVSSLLEKGMTCARINCAHDNPVIWQDMIGNIRHAETETGRSCRILMDQNRTQTIQFLKSHVAYFGLLIASFIAYIHWLLLKANSVEPPQLPNSLFFVGIGMFLLSILLWVLWLVLKFVRVPKD